MPMVKNSTIVHRIHTSNSQTETFKLESISDELNYDLDEVYRYLNSVCYDVKEEIIQNLLNFAEGYRKCLS
jgi:hypothetical protein